MVHDDDDDDEDDDGEYDDDDLDGGEDSDDDDNNLVNPASSRSQIRVDCRQTSLELKIIWKWKPAWS